MCVLDDDGPSACIKARHSHSWVLEVPTWPVEWMQMSASLAWQDYMATGTADLLMTYQDRIHERTQVVQMMSMHTDPHTWLCTLETTRLLCSAFADVMSHSVV